jgi:peptidoglycan/xylan/chitin deacetylase (PgdA/CDA1 family)
MPAARIALWVTSIGAVAMLVRSIWLDPLPLWMSLSALLGYVGLFAAGIVEPRLEMFGDIVWRGRAGSKRVALTFDDGPHPVTTRAVLARLAARGGKATFFVLGQKTLGFPDVVREIHSAGHTLGVHGYAHPWLYALKSPQSIARDIARAQDAVEVAVGIRPVLFRPPIGRVSPRVAEGARRAGVTTVGWTVRGLDGVRRTQVTDVVRRVEKRLCDGAIVLLHDAAENDDYEPAGISSLEPLLELIERRGLKLVSVAEFVADA